MRRFFSAMVQRPIAAIVSGITLIGQRLPSRQLIDGSVSRFIYTLIRPVVIESGDDRNSQTNRRE